MRSLRALLLLCVLLPVHAWADPDGLEPTYVATVTGTAATATKDVLSVFNASGSGRVIRIRTIRYTASNSAAVATGLNSYAIVSRTTTAGTTCTNVTIRSFDSANAAVPAQVTAGTNCSSDPTVMADFFSCVAMTEESAATDDRACYLYTPDGTQPITLREGEGLMIRTTGLNAVGAVTVSISFTMGQ